MNQSRIPHRIEILEARIAPATFIVSNNLDSGPGSLRQALLDANNFSGLDLITFSIPASSVITVLSPLPAITDQIGINGLINGQRISIDGHLAAGSNGPNEGSGLMLYGQRSNGSSIRGLAIYGFDKAGIEIVNSSNNLISQNCLGVDRLGFSTKSKMAEGILIDGGTGNKITDGNIIGENETGIRLTGNAIGTIIDGNHIGISSVQGNTISNDIGILVETASQTRIGSASGNTIAGNQSFGIKLASGASDTVIVRNKIGQFTANLVLGPQEWGIFIDGARQTRIGDGSFFSEGEGNTIVGNSAGGIWLHGETRSYTDRIAGNIIGLSTAGESGRVGNGGPGILVVGTSVASIDRNIISGNLGAAIEIRSPGMNFSGSISGNMIGTDIRGTVPLGNGMGIIVDGGNRELNIGQIIPNTIVASGGDGILIKNSTTVWVRTNYIGYSPSAPNSSGFGNAGHGIHLMAVGRVSIGGGSMTNTIAFNGGDGIFLDGDAPNPQKLVPDVVIDKDLIGLEGGGNGGAGIHIADLAPNGKVQIGTLNGGAIVSNILNANSGGGMLIERSAGVQIVGNRVSGSETALRLNAAAGTIVSDNDFRSTGTHAVIFDHETTGTLFGDLGRGNLVASPRTGILVESGNYNSFAGNRIEGATSGITILAGENNLVSANAYQVGSGRPFVDLGGDGPTPNDPLDADSGPNTLQNSPSLVSAAIRGGQTLLRGEYRGAANSDVRIEWYVDGEFAAAMDVHTDENGVASLDLDLDHAIDAGAKVSASATSNANTSEFSPGVIATTPPEVIAKGASPGQKPRVQLRDALTGEVLVDQLAFSKAFRGGVKVAAADVDGDGFTDLIATPRTSSGMVKVFSGFDGHLISKFQMGPAKDSALRSLAAGDLDGDGSIEVVVARAGVPGGPVLVYDALSGTREAGFIPFGLNTPERISLRLVDRDGDGLPEIHVRAKIFAEFKDIILDPYSSPLADIAQIITSRMTR